MTPWTPCTCSLSSLVLASTHQEGSAEDLAFFTRLMDEYLEEMAKLMGLEFIYTLVTLKHRGAQRYFESHGYELVGFMPGYDREEVSPGVVKRVIEAAYVKCLSGSESILTPDVANMTATVRMLYEVMYAAPLAPSAA